MIGSILLTAYGLICLCKNLDFAKQHDDDPETPLTEENEQSPEKKNARNVQSPLAVQKYDSLSLTAKHPVQALSELAQKTKLATPQYDVMKREGNMAFMKVTAGGHVAIGQAPKLKMAKVEAARALLSQMGIDL